VHGHARAAGTLARVTQAAAAAHTMASGSQYQLGSTMLAAVSRLQALLRRGHSSVQAAAATGSGRHWLADDCAAPATAHDTVAAVASTSAHVTSGSGSSGSHRQRSCGALGAWPHHQSVREQRGLAWPQLHARGLQHRAADVQAPTPTRDGASGRNGAGSSVDGSSVGIAPTTARERAIARRTERLSHRRDDGDGEGGGGGDYLGGGAGGRGRQHGGGMRARGSGGGGGFGADEEREAAAAIAAYELLRSEGGRGGRLGGGGGGGKWMDDDASSEARGGAQGGRGGWEAESRGAESRGAERRGGWGRGDGCGDREGISASASGGGGGGRGRESRARVGDEGVGRGRERQPRVADEDVDGALLTYKLMRCGSAHAHAKPARIPRALGTLGHGAGGAGPPG
jgi:hypothetical protein